MLPKPLLHMYIEFVLERTSHDKITLSAKKHRGDNNSPLADLQDCEPTKRKIVYSANCDGYFSEG